MKRAPIHRGPKPEILRVEIDPAEGLRRLVSAPPMPKGWKPPEDQPACERPKGKAKKG